MGGNTFYRRMGIDNSRLVEASIKPISSSVTQTGLSQCICFFSRPIGPLDTVEFLAGEF